MPGGDGTGPAGMGPMTGRAAGYCAGYAVPGYMNPFGGRWGGGYGRGRGRGRFWGSPAMGWGGAAPYGWAPPYGGYASPASYSAEQEKQALDNQVKFFEDQIDALRKRIVELEAEAAKEDK